MPGICKCSKKCETSLGHYYFKITILCSFPFFCLTTCYSPHLDCSCAFCYLSKFSSSYKSLLNSNLFHESADLSLLWIVLNSQHGHSLTVRCSHCSCWCYWSWLPITLMLLVKLYMKQAIQGSCLFFLNGGLLFQTMLIYREYISQI